jgi:hypothetical protein
VTTSFDPLMPDALIERLRLALARGFTTQAVTEVLGLAGEAALAQGDLAGAERLTRGKSITES